MVTRGCWRVRGLGAGAVAFVLALGAACGHRGRPKERDTPAVGVGMQATAGAASEDKKPLAPASRGMTAGAHGTDPDAEPMDRVGVGSMAGAGGGVPMMPQVPVPDDEPVAPPPEQQQPQVVCRRTSQLSGSRSDGTIGSIYLPAYWDGHAFIETDAESNIVIVGSFLGTIDLGGGPQPSNGADWALFVAKYDAQCNHLWSRTFGSPAARVEGGPIAIDARGDILLGGSLIGSVDFGIGPLRANPGEVNGFLVKLRGDDGAVVFDRVFLGGASYVRATSVDGDGNAIISGTNWADTDLGAGELGGYGSFVAKYSPQGDYVWGRRLPAGIDGTALRSSVSGDLTLHGFTRQPLSWEDGSTLLEGTGWLYFMSQLDPQGVHRWSVLLAAEDISWGYRVAFDRADIAYASFGTLPDADMKTQRVLERIDASGRRLSTAKWNGAPIRGSDAWDLAADLDGHVIELGRFSEALALGDETFEPMTHSDLYLAKRDAMGRVIWAAQLATPRENNALGVAVDAENHPVMLWYTVDRDSLTADLLEIVKFAP